MTKYKLPPLCPETAVCAKCVEKSKGRIGVHSRKERRYKCHECGVTFSDTHGTVQYGLKYPYWIVLTVLTLLGHGCPVQAIVLAFGIDERTVSAWLLKAGQHAKDVQEHFISTHEMSFGQVQGDEMYVKTQYGKVWIATAISVFPRFLIWAAVSEQRDRTLIDAVVEKVWSFVTPKAAILWAVDGFAAWKGSILKHFRLPLRTGKRGRPKLIPAPGLHLVQVVKQRVKGRIVSIERRLVHGSRSVANEILFATQTQIGLFNTAYVERFNATIRTWVPATTRRSRTQVARQRRLEAALFWTIGLYNFCLIHDSIQTAPAVAADFITQPWSIDQLIRFRPHLE